MKKYKHGIYEVRSNLNTLLYQMEVKIINETDDGYIVKYVRTLYNEGTKAFMNFINLKCINVPKKFKPEYLKKDKVKIIVG